MLNSFSRVSSSSPSSTPTETCATSSEHEDELTAPPIVTRPERTKSIVSLHLFYTILEFENLLFLFIIA